MLPIFQSPLAYKHWGDFTTSFTTSALNFQQFLRKLILLLLLLDLWLAGKLESPDKPT